MKSTKLMLALLSAAPLLAQNTDSTKTANLQEVQIVGSRNVNRSATKTAVPVDVLPMANLLQTMGQMDVNQVLQFSVPSFNANKQSGSDGSDHTDPATLRGLGPDQTLVLVNGKRRHQSSLVNIFGTRGRGNTGTDLNAIPSFAIDRVEVLRDGASAQYGSDAIAGVINVVTKRNVGTSLSQSFGLASRGDGGSSVTGLNYGKRFDGGFVNATLEHNSRAKTQRDAGDYREKYGDASSRNSGIWLNSEFALGSFTAYVFGGANHRVGDAYAWTRSAGDDRNIPSIYPEGFNPQIQATIVDYSATAGIKGKLAGWDADLYASLGSNRFSYFIHNTLNTSMGANTLTEFDAGGFGLGQKLFGLSFNRYFGAKGKGVNVAWGAENRLENYYIFAGQEESWQNYDPTKASGSQGFPGFRPSNVVEEGRNSLGAFADLEWDVNQRLMLSAAVRAENYSDFGNTLNGKIAGRLALSENLAVRGSFSTGFRAPSLAQMYFNSTFTNFVSGQAVDVKLANNSDALTTALGIPKLKQETAQNISLGLTATPAKGLSVTLDGYQVTVADRVVLTGGFDDADDIAGPFLQAENVSFAQFFTNAVNTQTRGLDLVVSYAKNLKNAQRINLSAALNVNQMEITDIYTNELLTGKEDSYFGRREQLFLLASAPPMKGVASIDYHKSKFSASLRGTYFAGITLEDWVGSDDVYDPRVTLDLSLSYALSDALRATLGVSNLTDALPTLQDSETEGGGLYDPVQMGSMGRYFFARASYRF